MNAFCTTICNKFQRRDNSLTSKVQKVTREWKIKKKFGSEQKSWNSKYHPDHQRGNCLVFGAPDEIYLCPNTTHSAVCHGLMAPLAVETRPRLSKCTVRRSYRNCVMPSSVCLRIQSAIAQETDKQKIKGTKTAQDPKFNWINSSNQKNMEINIIPHKNIQISKSAISWKLGDFQDTSVLSICGNNQVLFQPDEKALPRHFAIRKYCKKLPVIWQVWLLTSIFFFRRSSFAFSSQSAIIFCMLLNQKINSSLLSDRTRIWLPSSFDVIPKKLF